ncbi:conserved exported hypothetical protein [Rhodococcus sp. RD6.2]|uniref:DUF3558 domain-containing protein n=1 Tax=Rhodococcus sp. RD6.2 TaxID=260936 RepID=UPI00063BB117|nr:DUF3558 domain-containing protein [Rhodococcus sp. RD6.2]CRK50453.1 conserved exported hypothetical protein [Rhodococcus sp. RD6.2]
MRTTIGVMLFAAALVSGCGTVSGQAEAEDPTASDPAFDPCEDIPDEALREVGMDPATEGRDILGVHQPGWNLCGWGGESVTLSAYASNYTLDDVRRHPDYVGFEEIELDGSAGLTFRHRAFAEGEICYAAVERPAGLLMVAASMITGSDPNVCRFAEDAVVRFMPYWSK